MPISNHATVIDLVLQAGIVVKFVLFSLLLFSIFSWAVIFFKFRQFREAERASQDFLEQFSKADRLLDIVSAARRNALSPLSSLAREGAARMGDGPQDNGPGNGGDRISSGEGSVLETLGRVDRTLKYTLQREVSRFETYLGFLATTGNVTPFIGLFGTVWGILNAFHQIGIQGTANLSAVAPGIAEALVATAAGLAAAVPAVVAYNYFINRMRKLVSQLEIFSGEFLSFVEGDLLRSAKKERVMGG